MEYRTREQWGAEFDVTRVPVIKLPVTDLFVHHTAGNVTSNPNDDMLTIERIDINKFGKPSYDWGIHPSGVVLEGMTNHLSPDTYGRNRDSLSIMFMGNFENGQPTDAAMNAGRELVRRIISDEWVKDARILGHRDTYPTACPGANLYPRIGELLTGDDDMSFDGDDRAQLDNVRADVTTAVKEVRDVRTDVTSLHIKVDQAMQRLDKIIAKLK